MSRVSGIAKTGAGVMLAAALGLFVLVRLARTEPGRGAAQPRVDADTSGR